MTCPRCRAESFSSVCPVCATPLTAEFIPIVPEEKYPVVQILKDKCRSPLSLILAIVMSLQLLSVIAVSAVSLFSDGVSQVQADAVMYCLFSVCASLPAAVSAWMIYSAAYSRSTLMKDGGFFLLQLLAVVSLVVFCGCAVFLIALVAFAVISLMNDGSSALIEAFPVVFEAVPEALSSFVVFAAIFIGVAAAAFAVCVLVRAVSTLSFLRSVARRGRGKGGVSALCGVGAFVFSAVLLVSALSYFLTGAYLSGVCEILSAALFSLTGTFVFSLRRGFVAGDDPFLRTEGTVGFANAYYPYAAAGSPCPPQSAVTNTAPASFAPASFSENASPAAGTSPSAEELNPYARIERR